MKLLLLSFLSSFGILSLAQQEVYSVNLGTILELHYESCRTIEITDSIFEALALESISFSDSMETVLFVFFGTSSVTNPSDCISEEERIRGENFIEERMLVMNKFYDEMVSRHAENESTLNQLEEYLNNNLSLFGKEVKKEVTFIYSDEQIPINLDLTEPFFLFLVNN